MRRIGWRWAADSIERCIKTPCNALRCSAEILHNNNKHLNFDRLSKNKNIQDLEARTRCSSLGRQSKLVPAPIMRRFLFLNNKSNHKV